MAPEETVTPVREMPAELLAQLGDQALLADRAEQLAPPGGQADLSGPLGRERLSVQQLPLQTRVAVLVARLQLGQLAHRPQRGGSPPPGR